MTDIIAKTAVKKARYFITQATLAQDAQADQDTGVAFAANFEAAIIYARSALDHLSNQLKPTHSQAGYRRWHDDRFSTLKNTDPLFEYLTDRRNFIIHQQPEKTNAQISLEIPITIAVSMSVDVTVTRADGTVEKSEPAPSKNAVANAATQSSKATRTFYFADSNWREKSAIEYVNDFIDICDGFVSEAERRIS